MAYELQFKHFWGNIVPLFRGEMLFRYYGIVKRRTRRYRQMRPFILKILV